MPHQPSAMPRMPSSLDPARRSPAPTALPTSKPFNAASQVSPYDMPIAVRPTPGMRRWLKGLLTGRGTARARIADIQQSMLEELTQVATLPLHEDKLARQIVQARDAETLWQLRHALADAICAVHGELVAHQKMTEISFMFAGLLRRRAPSDTPGTDNVVCLASRGQPPGVGT